MLQSLHIENFALIEELYLTFTDGVTVFTGETGAGKSILLDAIGMLAGKRASASFVRTGAEAFLVEGAFFLPVHNEKLKAFLAKRQGHEPRQRGCCAAGCRPQAGPFSA